MVAEARMKLGITKHRIRKGHEQVYSGTTYKVKRSPSDVKRQVQQAKLKKQAKNTQLIDNVSIDTNAEYQ